MNRWLTFPSAWFAAVALLLATGCTGMVGESDPDAAVFLGLDAGIGSSSQNGGSGSGGGASGARGGEGGNAGRPVTSPSGGEPPDGADAGPGGTSTPAAGSCETAVALRLPARKVVTSANAAGPSVMTTSVTVTRDALFDDFLGSCALVGCHGGTESAPLADSPDVFKLTRASFHERPTLGTESLARVLSNDPLEVMPPGSGAGAERDENDPLRVLAERLKLWEDKGFPDEFEIVTEEAVSGGSELPDDPYLLNLNLAERLTPIGNCVPGPTPTERLQLGEMMDRDAVFEAAESIDDLPDTLFETDLVSLDSAVLAERSVYSYAPGYTLYSDHAEKMRYVRVPMGETIHYSMSTGDFDIPENTRFYKTFLKKLIDEDGNEVYRKMETRLIVSRQDEAHADGTFTPRALKVVYAWDKDERMARKVTDPLRNGEPFADRLCPYVVDETTPRDPAQNPIIEHVSETCTYMTADELEDPTSGKVRHYAIPGSERCDQCHMGSHSRSYILGFSPFHVDRRPMGEGGVHEEPGESELGQLQRFVDYGIISGIAPGEAKLEESQGERAPRNDFELTAQAYMLSNCAFCHNPYGFPSVQNPVLRPFDMMPSEEGGVFEFPLELFSSRAKVGPLQELRHPYITPAFGDFEPTDGYAGTGSVGAFKVLPVDTAPTNDWLPSTQVDSSGDALNDPDQFAFEFDVTGQLRLLGTTTPTPYTFQYVGPWRSMIWRNVYTPFTYEEDSAIFIHMPRNVPGYDCRAQRILGEWMLSIPSIPKLRQPAIADETGLVLVPAKQPYLVDRTGWEQPYQEVKPGDKPYENLDSTTDLSLIQLLPKPISSYGYTRAAEEGLARVDTFRRSLTYQHCPDDDDIVDAAVLLSPNRVGTEKKVQSAPIDERRLNGPRVNPEAQGNFIDRVPDHAHWVPLDTTDPPGRWQPRRTNWKDVLVTREVPVSAAVSRVIDELHDLHLSPEAEEFSTEPVPMGLWHPKCRASPTTAQSPTIEDLRVAELLNGPLPMHRWVLDRSEGGGLLWTTKAETDAPVHYRSRGEAVFRAICINCHGKALDSRSPLASTISELTGGETRVANFLDGLLGPRPAPGVFAQDEFRVNSGATPAEWQVRYMIFMGLGGTLVDIPKVALELVKTSPFYGRVVSSGKAVSDANMLESARSVCEDVLTAKWEVRTGQVLNLVGRPPAFAKGTGHFELWQSLCNRDNNIVVRAFDAVTPSGGADRSLYSYKTDALLYRAKDEAGNWAYPEDAPVGNQLGEVELGIRPGNTLPWCIAAPREADREFAIENYARENLPAEAVPFCPPTLLATAFGGKEIHRINTDTLDTNATFFDDWTRHGAITAGVAAYYYLDGVTKGLLSPSPDYDVCE